MHVPEHSTDARTASCRSAAMGRSQPGPGDTLPGMGFSGRFAYCRGAWVGQKPTGEPSLVIDVHDSDVATVEYAPAPNASGRFYLGVEPRFYFDGRGSLPADRRAEALGFAAWVQQALGHELDPAQVERLMAPGDEDAEPEDDFVEETIEKLLLLAGLPLPPELAGDGEEPG